MKTHIRKPVGDRTYCGRCIDKVLSRTAEKHQKLIKLAPEFKVKEGDWCSVCLSAWQTASMDGEPLW